MIGRSINDIGKGIVSMFSESNTICFVDTIHTCMNRVADPLPITLPLMGRKRGL